MKVLRIIATILIISLLLIGCYGLIRFLNDDPSINSSSQDDDNEDQVVTDLGFYLKVNNINVTANGSGYTLSNLSDIHVTVVAVDNKSTNYSISIVPNGTMNYEFMVGNVVHQLSSEPNVSAAFVISNSSNGFTLKCSKNIQQFSESLYPGQSVTANSTSLTGLNNEGFDLIVRRGEENVKFTFKYNFVIGLSSVSLNASRIYF